MSVRGRYLVWAAAGVLVAAGGLAWSRSALPVPPGAALDAGGAVVPPGAAVPAGAREDAWLLPDEPLLGFVEVPGGPFLMGSDPARDRLAFENELWAGETAPRTVELPGFLMGRTEVTVGQFRAFVAATCHPANDSALAGPLDHPVTSVSWVDALAYARWLETTLKGWRDTPAELAARLREGWRVTLPTEAQWEKAARGTDGRIFPWGDEPRTDRANFAGRGTAPVGSHACPECPWGLDDMSGNVWEWTRTPFVPGPHRTSTPDLDLEADALWVMRGGSFADPERNVRAALRGGADPGVRRPFIGFRVALTPP